jgi:hypothetical protein
MDKLQRQISQIPGKFMERMLGELLAKKAASHGLTLSHKKRRLLAKRLLAGERRLTIIARAPSVGARDRHAT